MKKRISLFLTVLLVVSLFVPINVFAAEDKDISEEVTIQSANASGTVTDNHGNRYYVSGISNRTGKNASVTTQYQVTYYYGGTKEDVTRVDNYKKTLTSRGNVKLLGGGSNTLGGQATRTGKSNKYVPSQTYLYNVTSISSTHGFSCQGATWTRQTNM